MNRKLMLLLTFLFMGIGLVTAQNVNTVQGIVTSAEDGEPVVGASVLVKGTSLGAVTDIDGKFQISNVPASSTQIRVSYIGMQSQDMKIGKGIMHIALKMDAELLDEVVVTAMGMKRSEKSIGYAATSVKGDEISMKRTNDIMSSLSGKIAGVQITSTSSDPGSSNSVIIRGISSLSGSNQPLYVVDGVPLNNSSVSTGDGLNNGYDFGNGANAVNPDDVENMTILKGAAATAIYGSRAAGGVVMITTKSGKKGQGLGIEYNGGLQWSSVLRLPQNQNEFGMGWYGDKTDLENGSWGPRFDGTMQIYGNVYDNSQKMKPYVALEDNIKDFFDTGFRYNNSISFNGATDKSSYYVSMSQISDDGMIPTDADSYNKYTFSARGSHKVKDLTFSTSLNYAYQDNDFATTGQGLSMYNNIMQTPRDISIIGLQDLTDPFNTPGYYYTPYGVTNPYYVLENYQNHFESERFYGKFQLDYDFLKYFKFTYRMGLDMATEQINTGKPNLYALFYDGTPNGEGTGSSSPFVGETGSVSQQITRRREINQDIMVTFNKGWGDFNVNALAGFNGNERKYGYEYIGITDLTIPTWFNISNTTSVPSTETYEQLRRLMGVYGQVEVAYKNMAYLTMTARNDWSSTLPKENRSFFYPGITGSFIFSELFDDDLKQIITFGKVRAAWGKTGNDAAPYKVNPVYAQGSAAHWWGWSGQSFPYNAAGYNAYTVGNTLGSNTLSPEMTTETEFGLNMAFLNNRLSFDVAYYIRNTDKQIYALNMDYASGFGAQNINLGEVENKGFEILVEATPIKTKDFTWKLGWNFTKNKSKVVSLPEGFGGEASIWGFSGGTGMYAIVGEPVGTFKATVPWVTEEGQIVCDPKTGLPMADPNGMQIVGDMNNDYQMGINTSFTYKGITLSADLDIRKGGLMYSRTKDISYFTGNAIQTAYNDRNPFIVPNSVVPVYAEDGSVREFVENTVALDNSNIYDYWDGGGSDLERGFLIDKSYVKLRSVVLSWDVPSQWLKKTFIRGLRISAFGNNLFVWTPSSNTFIDPEMTSFGNDLEGNFGEYSANPSSRRYGFNVNVKF